MTHDRTDTLLALVDCDHGLAADSTVSADGLTRLWLIYRSFTPTQVQKILGSDWTMEAWAWKDLRKMAGAILWTGNRYPNASRDSDIFSTPIRLNEAWARIQETYVIAPLRQATFFPSAVEQPATLPGAQLLLGCRNCGLRPVRNGVPIRIYPANNDFGSTAYCDGCARTDPRFSALFVSDHPEILRPPPATVCNLCYRAAHPEFDFFCNVHFVADINCQPRLAGGLCAVCSFYDSGGRVYGGRVYTLAGHPGIERFYCASCASHVTGLRAAIDYYIHAEGRTVPSEEGTLLPLSRCWEPCDICHCLEFTNAYNFRIQGLPDGQTMMLCDACANHLPQSASRFNEGL